MISSVREFHENFFKQFLPSVNIGGTAIPVFYAREAGNGISQKHPETYPQIIILDYSPDFNSDWTSTFFRRYDGLGDKDKDGKYQSIMEFSEPVFLDFRYDVSVYTKSPPNKWALQTYFIGQYGSSGAFVFNKTEIRNPQEDTDVGDVVKYKVAMTEVDRQDGVFELNYEFTLSAFVSFSEPQKMDLLRTLLLTIGATNYRVQFDKNNVALGAYQGGVTSEYLDLKNLLFSLDDLVITPEEAGKQYQKL